MMKLHFKDIRMLQQQYSHTYTCTTFDLEEMQCCYIAVAIKEIQTDYITMTNIDRQTDGHA